MDITRKLDYWKTSTRSIVEHTDDDSSVRLATLAHMKTLIDQYVVEIQAADQAAIDEVLNGSSGNYDEPPVED